MRCGGWARVLTKSDSKFHLSYLYNCLTESGVSHNKCSETYPGHEAFSEIETRNIRDFVKTLSPTPILGHCFHSYSQVLDYKIRYRTDSNTAPILGPHLRPPKTKKRLGDYSSRYGILMPK